MIEPYLDYRPEPRLPKKHNPTKIRAALDIDPSTNNLKTSGKQDNVCKPAVCIIWLIILHPEHYILEPGVADIEVGRQTQSRKCQSPQGQSRKIECILVEEAFLADLS